MSCTCQHGLSEADLCRTTYVGQVMAYEQGIDPDKDLATRTGEFAMLIYSIGAISSVLSHFPPS